MTSVKITVLAFFQRQLRYVSTDHAQQPPNAGAKILEQPPDPEAVQFKTRVLPPLSSPDKGDPENKQVEKWWRILVGMRVCTFSLKRGYTASVRTTLLHNTHPGQLHLAFFFSCTLTKSKSSVHPPQKKKINMHPSAAVKNLFTSVKKNCTLLNSCITTLQVKHLFQIFPFETWQSSKQQCHFFSWSQEVSCP